MVFIPCWRFLFRIMEKIIKNRERNRIHQNFLLKNNPVEYYKKLSLRVKKWKEENPEKVKAYRIIFVEKRAGRIKSEICFCGNKKTEAHHKDYSKPLKIKWLCKKHHRQADRMELSTEL